MVEQSQAGEAHDHIVPVTGFDDRVVPDGAAGLGDVADAAAEGPLDIVGEGEEGVGAQGHAPDPAQIFALLLRGEGLGPAGEEALPHALGADVLLVPVDVAVDGVVPVRAAQLGTEGQIQDLVRLPQEPGVGLGAGQQSRIHCTRLAGTKADSFFLRQSDKVLNLPFKPELGRADRNNVVDNYINKSEEDVCADGVWQRFFTERPAPLTEAEKRAYLDTIQGVSLGSDAFFPFSDNIERARLSGVKFVAQPGGSIRDDLVIGACDKYGMVMCFTHMRLFHH